MDISLIKTIINDDETKVMLHLLHWTSGGSIKSVSPGIKSKFEEQLKKITNDQLDYVEDLTRTQYNVIGTNSDVLEIIDKNDTNYENYKIKINKVLDAIKKPVADLKIKSDSFDFFVYEFILEKDKEDKRVFVFRRTRKFKSFKKGFIGRLIPGGCFLEIENKDLLGTDDIIDFVLYEGEVAILQHISFERILHLSNEFLDHAKNVLDKVDSTQKINNFEKLKNDALNNASYIKRLSKLDGKNDNTATLFLKNLSKTNDAIKKFGLDIKVDLKKEKIEYEDATQLGNFINFMQDAYYKTFIGEKLGVDERR